MQHAAKFSASRIEKHSEKIHTFVQCEDSEIHRQNMAILSKSKLAKLATVATSTVTLAIQDGRIICSMQSGKSVIDTKEKRNAAQILMWQTRQRRSNAVNTEGNSEKIKVHKVKETPNQKLDREKKQVELDIKLEALEKSRLEKRKLQGEMVPTDMIGSLFTLLGSSFQKTYKSQNDTLINELFHRAKVDPAIAAEFKTRFLDMINEAHVDAIELAKKSLKAVVSQQSANK
jgi:hypothetical protein